VRAEVKGDDADVTADPLLHQRVHCGVEHSPVEAVRVAQQDGCRSCVVGSPRR
jgi:hypothetical protein